MVIQLEWEGSAPILVTMKIVLVVHEPYCDLRASLKPAVSAHLLFHAYMHPHLWVAESDNTQKFNNKLVDLSMHEGSKDPKV